MPHPNERVPCHTIVLEILALLNFSSIQNTFKASLHLFFQLFLSRASSFPYTLAFFLHVSTLLSDGNFRLYSTCCLTSIVLMPGLEINVNIFLFHWEWLTNNKLVFATQGGCTYFLVKTLILEAFTLYTVSNQPRLQLLKKSKGGKSKPNQNKPQSVFSMKEKLK